MKRLILALLWLEFFVAYLDRTNISVAGPTMMKALNMTPQAFGYVLAAFTAGYALMQIPGGMLADRFGAKRMLVIALVLWSIFTGLTGLAASIGALIIIRVCFGIGEGLESGGHFKALGDTFDSRERAQASGVFHSSLALGPACAAPLAATLIAAVGWNALFLWFTIPGVIMALLIWRFFPRTTGAAREQNAAPADGDSGWGALLAHPQAWWPFAAYLFFNVAFWGLVGWMPSYLSQERHIMLSSLGLASSLPYFCGFFGLLILGYLGSKSVLYRYRPLLAAASYLFAGLGLWRAFTAGDVPNCLFGLSFAAFFLYGSFAPFWAITLELVPAPARGVLSTFVNFGGQIAGFFSPIVVGTIVQNTSSFSGGFVFMIGALFLACATMLAIQQQQRLPRAATAA